MQNRGVIYLQDGLEVAKTLLRVEKERVGSWPELGEGGIIGSKDSTAYHLHTMDKLGEVRLLVSEQQSRELRWEQGQLTTDEWWRHQNALDGVNDTVLGSLSCLY